MPTGDPIAFNLSQQQDAWLDEHAQRMAQQEEERSNRLRRRQEARQALNDLIAATGSANCYRPDLFAVLSDFIDRAR